MLFGVSASRGSEPTVTVYPEPAPGAIDNPLKGWCPYPNVEVYQPYSMSFQYVRWKDLEPIEGQFAFEKWEQEQWEQPRSKGKHVVFRVFIDYPGKESGLPDWLREKGVPETAYEEHGGGLSPDYDRPEMVAAMERLIAALGERYNRHPRVAFIELGLLGFWGEWHCYPKGNELYASEQTEARVLSAYRRALPNKSLMVRYANERTGKQRWIGFHDDLLPADTDGEDWGFLPKLRKHGGVNNWRRAVFGGEMQPGQAAKWLGKDYETTRTMVERAHFSWMGPYCPSQENPAEMPGQYLARCHELVRRMGYNFRITKAKHHQALVPGQPFRVALLGENLGVAPFYYPWAVEFALIDGQDRVVAHQPTDWDLRRWQPGKAFSEEASLSFGKVPAGSYRLALGIRDPWKDEAAIGFANRLNKVRGWSVFSRVEVE